jgi:hypothetical protein
MGISIQGSPPMLQKVPVQGVVESSSPTSMPLGWRAMPFFQSDMPNTLPLPFPLPKDFQQMEENALITGEPLIYLQ